MAVKDYDSTPANNTTINSINIAENCAPANLNNAIRQMMADLASWYGNSSVVNVVEDYEADNTGSGDTYTEVQAALTAGAGGIVFFPEGDYLIATKLSVPANTTLIGANNQTTKIIKGANITLMDVAGLSQLHNLYLDGDGSSFTGKGVHISTGAGQVFRDLYIKDCEESCVYVDADMGSQMVMDNCHVTCTTADDPAIVLTSGIGNPHYFHHMNADGGRLIDTGSSQVTYITDSYFNNITTNADTAILFLKCCRVATLGATTTIRGTGHVIEGVSFAGAVEFGSEATGIFYANNVASGVTFSPSAAGYNSVQHSKQSYTPTWSQASGTPPAIGNGTLTGEYSRDGMCCYCNIYFVAGSTSTFGDGTDAWTFTLPYPGSQLTTAQGIVCAAEDNDANLSYPVLGTIGSGSTTIQFKDFAATGSVRSSAPFTWAQGDRLILSFSYHTDR